MSETANGSCLCGAVRFRIDGPFESFFLCHCSRCRKDTGSAHAANLFSTTATIAWLSGQERVSTYRLPATRHERSFCADCGSAVPSAQMEGRLLVVPAGSLDTPLHMRPNAHICLSDRAAWDVELEKVAGLPGLPG